MQLEDGALTMRTRVGGVGPHVLRTNISNYADGGVHRLRVVRKERQLSLIVDEQQIAATMLDGGAKDEPLLRGDAEEIAMHYVSGGSLADIEA